MLRYALFKKEEIITGEDLSYQLPKEDEFIWIFIHHPDDVELQRLVTDFGLDIKVLKNYHRATHSKRYSTKPFQFTFVDYFLDGGRFKSVRILFILEKNVLITILPQFFPYYNDLFTGLSKGFPKGQKRSLANLLYYFLEEDTEENYDVLANTEAQIVNIERKLMVDGKSMANVNEIISLKRELFHMTRRFWASAKIIFAIKKGLTPLVLGVKTMHLYDDIYHTFQHQLDIATAQKEMLADALQIYTASISNYLATSSNSINKTMKFLTALTVIIMVPTLVASIYGMNFKYIPLSESHLGFYYTVGIMMTSLLLLGIYFLRKNWL